MTKKNKIVVTSTGRVSAGVLPGAPNTLVIDAPASVPGFSQKNNSGFIGYTSGDSLGRFEPRKQVTLKLQPAGGRNAPGRTRVSSQLRNRVLSLNSVTAASIALPHEFAPHRVSDEYTTKHTSIASPFLIETLDCSNAQSRTGDVSPNGTMVIMLFKDAARAYGRTVCNPNNLPYNYAARFVTVATPTPSMRWNFGGELEIPFCHFVDTNSLSTTYLHPHGEILYAGQHEARKGIWMNYGEGITINVGSAPTGAELMPKILRGKTWIGLPSVEMHTNTVFIAPYTAYYSFTLRDDAAPGDFTDINYINLYNSSAFPTIFGWLPLPGVVNKAGVISACRIIAASLLVSNVSQALKSSGVVNMAQASPGTDIPNLLTNAVTFAGQDPSQAYSGKWDNGVYGYVAPIGPEDFMFKEPFITQIGTGSSTMLDCAFELVPDLGFLVSTVVSAVDASGSEVIYPANVALVTTSYGVEFITNDNWFVSDMPHTSVDAYKHGLILLKTVPQFHENPKHIKQILEMLLAGGKGVLKYGPQVLAALTALAPEAAPVTVPTSAALVAVNTALRRYGLAL
jgi:hypothetical protein